MTSHRTTAPGVEDQALFINSHVLQTIANVDTDRTPLNFHRRLPGYASTPLVESSELAAELELGRVWVKDESNRLGLMSFKMLGASYAIYRALCDRLGTEPGWSDIDQLRTALTSLAPLTLVAATDGNHGLAVARMARLLGLSAHIYVPGNMVTARIEAIEAEDARVSVVDGDYDETVHRSAKKESDTCVVVSDTSWPGYEHIPWSVIEGYSTIFWEIDDALADAGQPNPDVIVVPMGVGSLAAAAVRHYRRDGHTPSPTLIGVEPATAACVLESLRADRPTIVPGPHTSIMAGLNCGTPSPLAWPLLRTGIDIAVAIPDDRTCQAMRRFADANVTAGETGAAGLGALYELHDQAPAIRRAAGLSTDASVLILVTEGATDPDAYAGIAADEPHTR